ncbi:M17 family metallopeptidase [Celerinatantimonas yamalensis]|uniref:Leucyl aminopeptidase family protein n=1 Tax=Celerinatantimonas yamalensis TaxID=559956 RepID=A0ABW9GCC8_9GAMM
MNTFNYPELHIICQSADEPSSVTHVYFEETLAQYASPALQTDFAALQTHFPQNSAWQLTNPYPAVLLKNPTTVLTCSFAYLTQARQWLQNDALTAESLELVGGSKQVQEAFVSAWLAQAYQLPTYKKPGTRPKLQRRYLYLHTPKLNEAQIYALCAEAKGNALARYLAWLPAGELTPQSYQKIAQSLATTYGWDITVYDRDTLTLMGAGAFLAVCRGDAHQSAIVRLRYRPTQPTHKVALVGKGICFDTGGYNLKKDMQGMQMDMGGSAVALGSLLAATEQNLPYQIDCYLAIAENHIGPNAYKTAEVVTALNGTTIEIIDTDAEGRMVLADTLTLASREKPDLMIDYATLTGACKRALGHNRSGLWSNQHNWLMPLLEIGERCGERIWPQPIDADYDDDFKSDIADIAQCAAGPGPDHIHAARFLLRFIGVDDRWIHIDLSSFHVKNGLAQQGPGATGFGVRYTQRLLAQLPTLLG